MQHDDETAASASPKYWLQYTSSNDSALSVLLGGPFMEALTCQLIRDEQTEGHGGLEQSWPLRSSRRVFLGQESHG